MFLLDNNENKPMQVDLKEVLAIIINNDIEKPEYYDINSPYYAGWVRGVLDSVAILRKAYNFHEDIGEK